MNKLAQALACPRRVRGKLLIQKARTLLLALPLGLMAGATQAQDTIEWLHLGGDADHTRYSPAAQINRDNFGSLQQAWV